MNIKLMLNCFKKNILLIIILILAFFLRIYKYYYFPVAGETADERAWSMLGSSLIQTGIPTAWSYFGIYEKAGLLLQKEPEPIAQPSLDHPPLFALIPGFFHNLKYQWNHDPSMKLIRLPMIVIGVINVALLYFLSEKIYGKKTALLAALIYATAPSFVFSSRLVVAENFLVTLSLLAFIVFLDENIRQRYLYISVLMVLAVMSKVAGLILPATFFIYALIFRNKKLIKTTFLAGIAGVLIFFAYGASYNWMVFWNILTSQSLRDLGLATLYNRFFLHPSIVEKIYFDAYLILGLLTSLWLIFNKDNKNNLLNIFFICNCLFISLSVGEKTYHAWYDYLFYPGFALSIAYFITDIYQKKRTLVLTVFWLMILPVLRLAFIQSGLIKLDNTLLIRFLILLSLIPFFMQVILKKNQAVKLSMLFMLGIILLSNILAVLTITDISYWENESYFLND